MSVRQPQTAAGDVLQTSRFSEEARMNNQANKLTKLVNAQTSRGDGFLHKNEGVARSRGNWLEFGDPPRLMIPSDFRQRLTIRADVNGPSKLHYRTHQQLALST